MGFDGHTGDNDFDLHFDSVATFILILTSLILFIVLIHISILSLVDVYSSMMYIVHQGSVLSHENGFNPLNGDSPKMDAPFTTTDQSKVVSTKVNILIGRSYDL